MFKIEEKKRKVLEIIPYDLDKNHCENITSLCLRMCSGVTMKNVATGGDKQVLCITEGVQTVDVNVSDEEGSRRSKGEDDS